VVEGAAGCGYPGRGGGRGGVVGCCTVGAGGLYSGMVLGVGMVEAWIGLFSKKGGVCPMRNCLGLLYLSWDTFFPIISVILESLVSRRECLGYSWI
jgi:hypothetical protein